MEFIAKITYTDGRQETLPLEEKREGEVLTLSLSRLGGGISFVDFAPGLARAKTGEEGYFVIPQGGNNEDCMLAAFLPGKEGTTYEGDSPLLNLFGMKSEHLNFAAAVTGMRDAYHFVAAAEHGVYTLFPRFVLKGTAPEEPLSVRVFFLPEEKADYNEMARVYREYLLHTGFCRPIAERENEALRYAKESLCVRVRMGWKPAPSPVARQTPENEPPMRVAATFSRVGKLMEALREEGIDKAEFCLVGWNCKGHDGRWPQAFPVEPALGGEDELRLLIRKAREMGYRVTCHTNSNSAYTVAEGFTEDWLRRDEKGEIRHSGFLWSGGLEYELCPQVALDFAKKTLPRVAELGFAGLHYVDVLSVLPVKDCHHPAHPSTYAETRACNAKIAALSKKLFGGFSSEGAREHMADSLDFGLYVSYFPFRNKAALPSIASDVIPLWQLVFHGIVLSNPYTDTVNAPLKGRDAEIKLLEYGGRPTLYFYSRFVDENKPGSMGNWMGNSDFVTDTEEDIRSSARLAGKLYREFRTVSDLQDKFMESYEKVSATQSRVVYSDGSVLLFDYEKGTVTRTCL
ncbi:MAG: DUF5696 domain-containing protein [Clostridia bacterium]|nr:DUF5696 domain-containing protein [Clostridia bacterium]